MTIKKRSCKKQTKNKKITYPNGDIYEGEFVDGKKHGKGVSKSSLTGDIYEGEFVNDATLTHALVFVE